MPRRFALKLSSPCLAVLSFGVFIGCGGDDAPGADGSAGAADAAASSDAPITDAATTTDVPPGTDLATAGDSATMGPAIPAMGDVNCLIQRQEVNRWTYGFDTQCVVTVA